MTWWRAFIFFLIITAPIWIVLAIVLLRAAHHY